MRFIKTTTGFVVRLDLDEDVIEGLTAFVKASGIAGGAITGIGAVKKTVLGYFDAGAKAYVRQDFPDEMELINLAGNITWVDDEPFVHAHAVISGRDYVARSGHLFSARIAVTGEFYVHPSDIRLTRVEDSVTGLKLISD